MKNALYVPDSPRSAARHIRRAFAEPLERMPRVDFVHAWCSLAYLFPGLDPDSFDEAHGGWPRVLKPVATEAWRRVETGELVDEEIYPSDSQWSGLYDRMTRHTREETERRAELAANHGNCPDA